MITAVVEVWRDKTKAWRRVTTKTTTTNTQEQEQEEEDKEKGHESKNM